MIRFDNHAFRGLDESLKRLYALISSMGEGVEALMQILPEALEHATPDTFAQAKAIDKTINTAELEVDATVAAMINKFTVMGEDLRFTLACIKIAGTLERSADKIKNSTKRLSRIGQPLPAPIKQQLSVAITAARAMLPLALSQILDYKPEVTQALLKHGAAVQNAYRTIVVTLHSHNGTADDETHILLVAKNLEQAADMIVEIMKISHYVHFGTKFEKASLADPGEIGA